MLTVLVSTILNSQVFLLKKNVSSFCKCKSYSHFFSKNISIYAIFNDQSFNDTLTNNIVSFEQMGPEYFSQMSRNVRKHLLTCAANKYSYQPGHPRSLISFYCWYEVTTHHCLSKMCPLTILIRLRE